MAGGDFSPRWDDSRRLGSTLGTFDHPRYEIVPTGREFTCRMIAVFEFEPEGDGIVCERVYFDSATILAQLAG